MADVPHIQIRLSKINFNLILILIGQYLNTFDTFVSGRHRQIQLGEHQRRGQSHRRRNGRKNNDRTIGRQRFRRNGRTGVREKDRNRNRRRRRSRWKRRPEKYSAAKSCEVFKPVTFSSNIFHPSLNLGCWSLSWPLSFNLVQLTWKKWGLF